MCICAICGRIIKWVAWVWQGCHTLLSVFWGITRTLTFCAFCAFRGRIRSRQVAWVWQGCHTLLSVFCGQYISARLVQRRPLHPLNFLWVPCILWEKTAPPPGGKHKEGMAECHALLFVIFAWLLHPIGGYCKPFTSSIDKPEPCAT